MRQLVTSFVTMFLISSFSQVGHGVFFTTEIGPTVSGKQTTQKTKDFRENFCFLTIMTIVGFPLCFLGANETSSINLQDLKDQGYDTNEVQIIKSDMDRLDARLREAKTKVIWQNTGTSDEFKALDPEISKLTLQVIDELFLRSN